VSKFKLQLILLFFPLVVSAQTQAGMGVKAGAVFSRSDNSAYYPVQKITTGIAAAVPLEIMFGGHIGFQMEFGYAQKKSRYESEDGEYISKSNVHYAELPLLLKYVTGEKVKLCLGAGGFIACGISGKSTLVAAGFDYQPMDFKINFGSFANRLNGGLAAGAGIKIPAGSCFLTADARYQYGLFTFKSSGIDGPVNGLNLAAGILFPL